ncbi:hypothetical protein GR158_12825 [Shinella sp. AETb1-6]|nr:hypothetical protein [Shinella sp. AETb1-6]MXN52008.1 hypothetical protein [Shinella sp. AETb1-6]
MKPGTSVKLSLETGDAATAKARFGEAYAALLSFWQAMRSAPTPLSHKQMLALAGEVRSVFVAAFDDAPGQTQTWAAVVVASSKARDGRLHPLKVPSGDTIAIDMERRFGPLVDIKLAQKAISIPADQRPALLHLVAQALDESALVNLNKAGGDYSDTGETNKYPAFAPTVSAPPAPVPRDAPGSGTTFSSVIDEEVRRQERRSNARDHHEKVPHCSRGVPGFPQER